MNIGEASIELAKEGKRVQDKHKRQEAQKMHKHAQEHQQSQLAPNAQPLPRPMKKHTTDVRKSKASPRFSTNHLQKNNTLDKKRISVHPQKKEQNPVVASIQTLQGNFVRRASTSQHLDMQSNSNNLAAQVALLNFGEAEDDEDDFMASFEREQVRIASE